MEDFIRKPQILNSQFPKHLKKLSPETLAVAKKFGYTPEDLKKLFPETLEPYEKFGYDYLQYLAKAWHSLLPLLWHSMQ